MEWHIVTGEYPPKWGGVSDYTYQISSEFSKNGDQVHVWAPSIDRDKDHADMAEVHALPRGFGFAWLRQLDRNLKSYPGPRNILIQYVPHMYGWKSMNLSFCWWIFRQRRHNVFVMFHEVAFPFRPGQRFRHAVLATVHRMMAWAILRSVRHSFTSTDPYFDLLRQLGSDRTSISLLRICSNIPLESYAPPSLIREQAGKRDLFTVGIFSNFSAPVRASLTPAIGSILSNAGMEVLLLGPGESFAQQLEREFPCGAGRVRTTGRLHVSQVGAEMQRCDALLQLYPDGASAARGTLIGALASGVPLVTTAGPATDRLLLDSEAILFADGSPESIREAVEHLRGDPEHTRELADRALRLYEDSFQPAVIVSRIRETAAVSRNLQVGRAQLLAD
ncbi:MAG TPA: glycosyltransferase family 4 protein [Bryobacteraceae bacterium]|nr:glycosyltransferase family 4 protein [Bryobacteraceae bacterium]